MTTTTRKNNRFQHIITGKSAIYTCCCCGKRTRETGHGEANLELCAYCFEEAGYENSLADGHITQEQFDAAIEGLKIQYNRK